MPPEPLPRHGVLVMLRRLVDTDLAAFQSYRHDPEVGRFQGWTPQPDAEAARFITEMAAAPLFARGRWNQFAVEDVATRSMVGDLGVFISDDGGHAEVGISLARHAQGAGRATEAVRLAIGWVFEATSVRRVAGITDARNGASARMLERAGMRRQGTLESSFRGEPCEEWVYAAFRVDRHRGAD